MNYEQFQGYVKENVTRVLGEECRVIIRKVLKNNDVELDGLTIYENGSIISPTIYLNEYYEEYGQGRPPGNIIAEILDLYDVHKDKMDFDVDIFKDFDKVKDKIVYKLINAVQNNKLLSDVPFIPLLDLAVVFYYIFDSTESGNSTAMIHNSHLELWNAQVEDLYEAAVRNTPDILEYDLRNMDEIIREMLVADVWNSTEENEEFWSDAPYDRAEVEKAAADMISDIRDHSIQMYVLTNKHRMNGAACILYDGVLQEFASNKGNDLYILPSSIHEVILVPAGDDVTKEQLDSMVCEVNQSDVEDGDILSDHVYIYRRDTGRICM
ncbi:DUF5688 family protein [Parasporobacterium paucivorans]|uniref:Uncharacterized protein n=1 Tax=Parasporobacterium paucivorans DSM 15970 TaxID=1122934 RepID=A0A1M6G268_9FIRM|nr:DUF5688 family protein [Parasporobacterium paucivorans]SHJ03957.1 hypothetical protein SAMN02745691_01228 [Parasporobacterium paucivorans DSM 15970]